MKEVFIGGTGRSGTTVLGYALSLHKRIFTIPFETRFILDPGGIMDLVDSLSYDWDLYKGDYALREFMTTMRKIYPSRVKYLSNMALSVILPKLRMSPPKYSFTIGKHWRDWKFFDYMKPPFSVLVPRNIFFKIIENFNKKIVIGEYRGFWMGHGFKINPKIKITRQFERKKILELARELVSGITENALKRYGKDIWVDHTPTNLNHVLFLHELFPDMKFIHIYRDPRDVVSSYKTKHWGGNSAWDSVPILKNTLLKWGEDKKKLPKGAYIEIPLEELVRNKNEILNKLTDFLNIEFDENMLEIDLSKSHSGRWKKCLTEKEVEFVEKELGWFMEKYGYLKNRSRR